jgi:protein farnesyltransferase subunit beta
MLVVASLLNILTWELVEGTASFISSCQTYEGGFSSSSCPYFFADPESEADTPRTLLNSPRPPLGEAHGGYTFCALASWVILQSFSPPGSAEIDTHNLARWLVQMQGSEAELGGFKGRTNKLVDGCYSWWVGGSFALLEALGINLSDKHPAHSSAEAGSDEGWDDVDGQNLFNSFDFRPLSSST